MGRTVYFDWSIRNGVYTLVDDAPLPAKVYQSLAHVLDLLSEGDRLIGEATFESFNLPERARLIELAKARGITFLTTPNRLTGRFRRRLGLGDKADEVDVQVIREIARDPSRLKPPALPDPAWIERRKRANRQLMSLRRSGTLTPKPRTPGRFNFTSDKDIQAQQWAAKLPPYLDQTPVRQRALGDGKDWSRVIVAAVGVASTEARTTREFDALAGLYAHAYPSQIRADLHHYAWAGGNQRARLNDQGKRDDLTLTDYRRELRWLYHHLRPIVTA